MREVGIDISRHRSKTLDEFGSQQFDYVITICDRANESCPIFPGTTERIHWSFDDPSTATGSEEQRLRAFRNVREGIQQRLRMFQIVAAKHQAVAPMLHPQPALPPAFAFASWTQQASLPFGAGPPQHAEAFAVSGRLSFSTTKASHSLPSGSCTQVLSCVA